MSKYQYLPSKALENAARKLKRVLTAPAEGGVIKRQTRGRIDSRRVHRALRGQQDFRKQPWVREQFTTAVTLVLDFSGSMRRNMPVLQASTRALCKVLEQSGNPYNCYAFVDGAYALEFNTKSKGTTRDCHDRARGDRFYDRDRGEEDRISGKRTECALWEVIGERDNMRQREDALQLIHSGNANSYTPDAPALMGAVQINSQMKADRHIVIMLTDGKGWGQESIQFTTRVANSMGVETVGIALNCNHIEEADGQYNACAVAQVKESRQRKAGVVPQADALTKGFFDSLTKQLSKGMTRSKAVIL